jgi:nucleotide-binding universal stress UspA family protein
MIRTMLFATDGFPANAAAQLSALKLAARFEAKISAFGVIDLPWITGPEAVPLGGAAYKASSEIEQLKSAHKRVKTALEYFEAAAAAEGVAVTTSEIEGDPRDVLTAEASRHDLIVIGRCTSFHMGSGEGVSDLLKALVRDSPRAVLAAADTATVAERALFAFDGSAAASRAMHMAALLGLAQSGQAQVLSIDRDRRVAETLAARAADLLRSHGRNVAAFGIQSEADPADMILSHAMTFGADMVVMGAYGHGGLRDVIFGSCTRRLLNECKATLFLQH